jgi:hypothetical protein
MPTVSDRRPLSAAATRYSWSLVSYRLTRVCIGPEPIGLVVIKTAPAIELLPNSVLCGPFRISTRAMSAVSLNACCACE